MLMHYVNTNRHAAALILKLQLRVIFEAGVAAGAGKPIWVFEDFKDNIKFPVPL
jgi:hypothetical protein